MKRVSVKKLVLIFSKIVIAKNLNFFSVMTEVAYFTKKELLYLLDVQYLIHVSKNSKLTIYLQFVNNLPHGTI